MMHPKILMSGDEDKSIRRGDAVIAYGRVPGIKPSIYGWVLPGGKHTTSRASAERAAVRLDKAMKSLKSKRTYG